MDPCPSYCFGVWGLFVYTVDEPEDLLRLQAWGVDAVFSNGPAKARLVLAQNA